MTRQWQSPFVAARSRMIAAIVAIVSVGCTLVVGPAFADDCATVTPSTSNPVVGTNGPASFVSGSVPVTPGAPSSLLGSVAGCNYIFYPKPGEGEGPYTDAKNKVTYSNIQAYPHRPYTISYGSQRQPISTNDWWNGIGLQWYSDEHDKDPTVDAGWVTGRLPGVGTADSAVHIAEPNAYRFVDWAKGQAPGNIPAPPAGLSIWNQDAVNIRTDGKQDNLPDSPYDPKNITAGRGLVAANNPVVTVGLLGVHPLGEVQPSGPPWSAVRVDKYSDWGVHISYGDADKKDKTHRLEIDLANGTPFAWFNRTGPETGASFAVWAGAPDTGNGSVSAQIDNSKNMLLLTVTTVFNADNAGGNTTSTASYALFANAGPWVEKDSPTGGTMAMFVNDQAKRVAVLSLPQRTLVNGQWTDIDPKNRASVAGELSSYACEDVVNTQFIYPPIKDGPALRKVKLGSSQIVLGYDQANSKINFELRETAAPFDLTACNPQDGKPALMLLMPHHVDAMASGQDGNLLPYAWNSLLGEMQAYNGNSVVEQLTAHGVLPFFPAVAINPGDNNPFPTSNPQTSEEDLYETLSNWFFQQESGSNSNRSGSFANNFALYGDGGANTYIQKTAAMYESMVIADQLSQSTSANMAANDSTYGIPKKAVAAQMRDYILQTLEELVGQWFSIYTTQFLQYNNTYETMVGYPPGYGAVQNFADHHFHYGYFLASAAGIGRYDPAWLMAYIPMLRELQQDVASYDRGSKRYPFLRNFSPYYGHNWADGTGQNGNNQESTSEAINFASGMIGIGQVLANSTKSNAGMKTVGKEWIDIGMYLYEQEVLATQEYWENVKATLDNTIPPPNGASPIYNGNWPQQFVTYKGPDGNARHTTQVGILRQRQISKSNFFAPIPETYAVQAIPLSASSLFLGRNLTWLQNDWAEYLLDVGDAALKDGTSSDEVLISSMQARLPGTGTDIGSPGPIGALARIKNNAAQGLLAPYATNVMGKNFAYLSDLLGQIDPTVVANTPSYAAFTKNGTPSFVAYNPGAQSLSVTFVDSQSKKTNLSVDPFSMATMIGAGTKAVTKLSPISNPKRLYLHQKDLTTTAGNKLVKPGNNKYPSDMSDLVNTLYQVGPNCDTTHQAPDNPPTDPKLIYQTSGTFSGKLAGGTQPVTAFSIYLNQIGQDTNTKNEQTPGWIRNPLVNGNIGYVRILYDFGNGATRTELYVGMPLDSLNSFTYQNKFTHYRGQASKTADGTVPVTITGSFPQTAQNAKVTVQVFDAMGPDEDSWVKIAAPYPTDAGIGWFDCTNSKDTVTEQNPNQNYCKNGNKIPPPRHAYTPKAGPSCTQITQPTKTNPNDSYWGASNAVNKLPFGVSVDADETTNRASWIQPPYN